MWAGSGSHAIAAWVSSGPDARPVAILADETTAACRAGRASFSIAVNVPVHRPTLTPLSTRAKPIVVTLPAVANRTVAAIDSIAAVTGVRQWGSHTAGSWPSRRSVSTATA
ncbi:hypothetical protein GCM10027068_13860 [Prescottella soli]